MNLARVAFLLEKVFGFARSAPGKKLPYLLYKSTAPVVRNSTNTTGTAGVDDDEEVILWTGSIPANLLSGSTSIFVHALFRNTNSASTKTLTLRLNTTSSWNIAATTNVLNNMSVVIHADNAANDQKAVAIGNLGFEAFGSPQDMAHDNSVALPITLSCKWGAAVLAETITLETVMVEVFPG